MNISVKTPSRQYTIATVVKMLAGYAWFVRMQTGVQKFERETGHKTVFLGPPTADEYLQVKIIDTLIEQGVDAICVVPIFPQALEMSLLKARHKGIVVISHEASNQRNVDYDLEAFDNAAYGVHLMDHLASYMGEAGEYAMMVGTLTSKTHSEWSQAAITRQMEQYPRMEMVSRKLEDHDDEEIAFQKACELLAQFPNLRGIFGCAMSSLPGAARAVEKAGLHEQVSVVGTCLPSIARPYLKNGSAKLISLWDPAEAGYVMNKLAVMVLRGETISNGMNLGILGYEQIALKGKIVSGTAWVDMTRETVDRYSF